MKQGCNLLHTSMVKILFLKPEGSTHCLCEYEAEQYIITQAENPTKKPQSAYYLNETPHIICLRTSSVPVATNPCLPSLLLFEEWLNWSHLPGDSFAVPINDRAKQAIRELNVVIYNCIYLTYDLILTIDWALERGMWTHRMFKSIGHMVPD